MLTADLISWNLTNTPFKKYKPANFQVLRNNFCGTLFKLPIYFVTLFPIKSSVK